MYFFQSRFIKKLYYEYYDWNSGQLEVKFLAPLTIFKSGNSYNFKNFLFLQSFLKLG
jgi:hypothetical protein